MKKLQDLNNLGKNAFERFSKLNQQNKVFIITALTIFSIFLLYGMFFNKKPKIQLQDEKPSKKFSLANDTVKAEDKWMIDGVKKLESLSGEIEDMRVEKLELMARLEEMQTSIIMLNETIEGQRAAKGAVGVANNDPFSGSFQRDLQSGQMEYTPKAITIHSVNLTNNKKPVSNFYKKTKNYIPQGAYAPGVLISAVDASVGTQAQANPRPVLIRLNGDAISSSLKGEKERTDVRGCVITGGAEGDISSEKVYIKLSRMTCTRKAGTAFEVAVKGYVSGFGSAGIRGVVVSRDWDKVSKAFVAGMIGGFGGSYADSLQPPAAITTTGTVLTQQQSLNNALKAGAGTGLQKSGDMLAEYYIKRAEQYQPVIEIPAGIDIEVVFLEGVSLEEGKPENQKSNQSNSLNI